jgi:hypothetical protein
MQHLAAKELGELPSWQELLLDSRPGPGASVASHQQNSFLEKLFTNEMSATSEALYTEWLRLCRLKPSWWIAELRRISLTGGQDVSVVTGSSFGTVPKNSAIDRTICTEPSLNMLFQKSLSTHLLRVLKRCYGFDKASQPDKNRELARQGSILGNLATIDLSSASDTISLRLVEAVLPSDWYAAILDCRSPMTNIDGVDVELNMVSSMGNGFTFPLMTYIYSVMLRALCRIHGYSFTRFDKFESWTDLKSCRTLRQLTAEFGVFGDDIILPVALYDRALTALRSIGCTPNDEKSFGVGHFRESCGTDWYRGVDIRGAYIKHNRNVQDLFVAINKLLRWSSRHGIPLPGTIQYLLPKSWQRYAVPFDEDDTAGIKSPLCLLNKTKLTYRPFKPNQKIVKFVKQDGRSKKRSLTTGKTVATPNWGKLKRFWDNPSGYLLAASAGAVSEGFIVRRNDNPSYTQVQSFTPTWECSSWLGQHGVSIADWRKYGRINLG